MADYDPYRPLFQPNEFKAFQGLFSVEMQFMPKEGYLDNGRHSNARQVAVSYIATHYKSDQKFDAFIPYLAMNYFDRFVSNHRLPTVISTDLRENLNLFVFCCLTIAWKMRIKSFSVVNFQRERGLNFNSRRLIQMELQILTTLEWRMRSLTPICFVKFFLTHLNLSKAHFNPKAVLQIIITAQADIWFTQFRPSILAASAVLTALANDSNVLPAQIDDYQQRIESCGHVNPMDLTLCMLEMEQKHKKNKAGGIGGGSGGGGGGPREGTRSAPIDIPGASTSQLPISFPAGGSGADAPTALLDAALPPTGSPRGGGSSEEPAVAGDIELDETGKEPLVKEEEDRGQRAGKEIAVEDDGGRPGKEPLVKEAEDRGQRAGKEIAVEEAVEEIKSEIKEEEVSMEEEDWMDLQLNWITDGQAAQVSYSSLFPIDFSDPPADSYNHCCMPQLVNCACCDIL